GQIVDVAGEGPIELDVAARAPQPSLDLMFVVDTTGSMSDELGYLKCALGSVLEQVRSRSQGGLDLRVSVDFYRDAEDEYVVRSFPFTGDADEAIAHLRRQSAGGGGDWEEALDLALDDAVFDHAWREAATARLLFLVADAPPHMSRAEVRDRLWSATAEAARLGVRVIPVAASGADQDTQMVYRTIAAATGGTHTWLTDDSGIGDSHTTPVVGEHQVEDLHAMLIRIIEEAL
ncbi:MAG TPA: vWA domain-containing protein, partial [Myxococcota bacterium]|nr:vWA domain-containing protein [Myxococcota bacterium]